MDIRLKELKTQVLFLSDLDITLIQHRKRVQFMKYCLLSYCFLAAIFQSFSNLLQRQRHLILIKQLRISKWCSVEGCSDFFVFLCFTFTSHYDFGRWISFKMNLERFVGKQGVHVFCQPQDIIKSMCVFFTAFYVIIQTGAKRSVFWTRME